MSDFFRQMRILARIQRQMLTARLGGNLKKSKLMVFTLGGFMLGYLIIGYLLFSQGLTYVSRLPGVGNLMIERVFYLMIFFFFIMLIFSNVIINYSSLFRSKETQWLLTLPIDHKALFSWKMVETVLVSSWGLIFLSAPLLAAYGRIFDVEWHFYVKSFLLYLPFVAIPGAVASWLLILTVRFANQYWKYALIATFVIGTIKVGSTLFTDRLEEMMSSESISLTFSQVLRHTEMSVNPHIPSTWMSEVILQWAKGYQSNVIYLFPLLLCSYALMGGWLSMSLISRGYYGAWNKSNWRRAESSWRRREKILSKKGLTGFAPPALWLVLLSRKRSMQALITKDLKCFMRDPSQWVQCAIVFGLLAIYVFNMRDMGQTFEKSIWTTVISYLNFAVISLALSTLTTRFVFPQFSLEGGRLWILGLAPFGIQRVIWQKFVLSLAIIGGMTTPLMLLSGYMLGLPVERVAFFVFAIVLMCIGLSGMSVGLGSVFPDFHEQNPAKIVSGFGGTLCLILNFLFIILFITALIFPAIAPFLGERAGTPDSFFIVHAQAITLTLVTVLSACAATIPMILGIRRVKRLELLGNL
ncbi:MAG: ABC-2 type transport system permease protein [Verrucomicrobiales bacterium]|jgi:ABC-2 type transport system permease protein